MGGRGAAGRPLPAKTQTPTPTEQAPADPGDLNDADLYAELDTLLWAPQLTPEQEARRDVVGTEWRRREERKLAVLNAEDAAERLRQHQEWRAGHGPDTPHEARLRAALDTLTRTQAGGDDSAPRDGVYVHLDQVRAALGDLTRTEFDTALKSLRRDPDIFLTPDADQRSLTTPQKRAALKIGGRDLHMAQLRDSHADAARTAERAAALTDASPTPATGPIDNPIS